VADKEPTAERAAKGAVVDRAAKEAAVKAAADEDVVVQWAVKAAGLEAAAGGVSPAPRQAPSVAGTKRAAAQSGSTSPAKRSYRGVWKPRFVQLVPLLLLFFFSFFFLTGLNSLITFFCSAPLLLAPLRARLLLP
jgi:hypothetical protein